MPIEERDLRHIEQQIQDIRHAAEVALTASHVEGVPLRQFFDAILAEKDRALAMADDEREKAASALRGEQQRALDQAGREREKAAENLKVELARAIREGDDRLREHIQNQIVQIQAALISAEKLEIERFLRADSGIRAVVDKMEVERHANEVAQSKFESSVQKSFDAVNEFRGSLDDLGKQMATRRELEDSKQAQTDAREQIMQAIGDLRSRIDIGPSGLASLQSRTDTLTGRQQGIGVSANVLVAVVTIVIAMTSVIVYIATHK